MQKLIEGVHHFQNANFRPLQELSEQLAKGQNSETLFIPGPHRQRFTVEVAFYRSPAELDDCLATPVSGRRVVLYGGRGMLPPALGGPAQGLGAGTRRLRGRGHAHRPATGRLGRPVVRGAARTRSPVVQFPAQQRERRSLRLTLYPQNYEDRDHVREDSRR